MIIFNDRTKEIMVEIFAVQTFKKKADKRYRYNKYAIKKMRKVSKLKKKLLIQQSKGGNWL